MTKGALSLILALCAALQPGLAAAADAAAAAPKPAALPADYRVGAGDVVSIVVFPVDEYSREVTVQPDGMIELPLLGGVLIKGLTAKELQLLLEQKYSKFVAGPKVTATVRRFSGRRVAIIGEVKSGGYYEYRDGLRVLELVSMAGGLTDMAKASRTKVLRQTEGKLESFELDVADILEGKTDRNPQLSPGDTIYVPKGRITRNAIWVNQNILPWLSLATLISSLVIVTQQ